LLIRKEKDSSKSRKIGKRNDQQKKNVPDYRWRASAAKAATESVTEPLGRRGGSVDAGAAGLCSSVPSSGAS
jgi:hypothetical protein